MVATAIYSVTNLPWCCGKKPHFLFAEPWKGVGKGCCLPGIFCDSGDTPANLLPSHAMYQLFLWELFLCFYCYYCIPVLSCLERLLGSRVVCVLDSGTEGPWFRSQPRRCRVAVLGKLSTPIVPLFTKQRNWQQPS